MLTFFSLFSGVFCVILEVFLPWIFFIAHFTYAEWTFLPLTISPLNICIHLTLCTMLFSHLYFQSNGHKSVTGSISWSMQDLSHCLLFCFDKSYLWISGLCFLTKQYLSVYWIVFLQSITSHDIFATSFLLISGRWQVFHYFSNSMTRTLTSLFLGFFATLRLKTI